MKDLRLVFKDEDGVKKDITLPMEKWISDWWFECNVVPPNYTVVLEVEFDGESIIEDMLDYVGTARKEDITFEEIAWYFDWQDLYDNYVGNVTDMESFEEWLIKNHKQYGRCKAGFCRRKDG